MIDNGYYPFGDAMVQAQHAIQASLHENVSLAQEILLQLRNKRYYHLHRWVHLPIEMMGR